MAIPTNSGRQEIDGFDNNMLKQWTLTTADHTGVGVRNSNYPDRSVQFAGTWGGATAKLEGSNDSTNGVDGVWIALSDPALAEISKTADGIEQVLEITRWVRPRLTAVGAGATVTASLFLAGGR